ncbi:MAG TPA: GDSL-type esterase/lipase family protein [Thermoanaerobaculia bacterium]|nr:GDSL-type esterase/lipase family protein [Thermoanaerobaculia bacterium]
MDVARLSSRLWLWYVPAAIGCAAAGLFATGFWLALSRPVGQPVGSAPASVEAPIPRPAGARLLLVLGDSLARGTGDESGKGYALDVLQFLRKRGAADIANLAINGVESGDVRDLLARENVRRLAASADLILLSVGGNDLSHAVPRGSRSPVEALGDIGRTREGFAANLREIFDRLRVSNPRAPVYVLGLYDPFGEGSAPGRAGASVILSWNTTLEETSLAYPGIFVVPTFDLFQGRADRLAVDRFHPNRRGYQAIAARVIQLLPDAL